MNLSVRVLPEYGIDWLSTALMYGSFTLYTSFFRLIASNKHFIQQPEPDPIGEMRFAKGYYESMYGRIESSWEKKGCGYAYRFVVPANTTATVCLRLIGNSDVTNVKPPTGAKFSKIENEKVFCEVFSEICVFKM